MGRKPKVSGGVSGAQTREKILQAAIRLFSEKGFSAVSIREIAAAVEIRGASIYNHFAGKDEILEAILERHKELAAKIFGDSGQATMGAAQAPGDPATALERGVQATLMQGLSFFGVPGVDKIFKILSREQLNNDRIREFFLREYIEGPRVALSGLFASLVASGAMKGFEPTLLANEFHAFVMYKYYENYLLRGDESLDARKMEEEFRAHIAFFLEAVRAKTEPS